MDIEHFIPSVRSALALAHQMDVDTDYIIVAGLGLAMVVASVLITLLVWVRYMTMLGFLVFGGASVYRWRKRSRERQRDMEVLTSLG